MAPRYHANPMAGSMGSAAHAIKARQSLSGCVPLCSARYFISQLHASRNTCRYPTFALWKVTVGKGRQDEGQGCSLFDGHRSAVP